MPDQDAPPFARDAREHATAIPAMTNSETGKVLVMTSGKGGVGKTTSSASIGVALARMGLRVVIIDFDIGLRNLDIVMGTERRVVYDLIHVIRRQASVHQATIEDRTVPGLAMIPASQTEGKEALTAEGVARVIAELRTRFDWIICDSPAGIDRASTLTMAHADAAFVVINLDMSSVRDADRVIALLDQAEERSGRTMTKRLLVTRYDASEARKGNTMDLAKAEEMLCLKTIGIIPNDSAVVRASNEGRPVTLEEQGDASAAYRLAAKRLTGDDSPVTVPAPRRATLWGRLFG